MNRLASIVENTDSRSGKAFDWCIQGLILVSLVTFAIDTLPDLSPKTVQALTIVERVTVGAFTLEYLLRLAVAERKLSFVFSFFGLIDLAAILPFYLTSGLDLRSLRAIRLLKLFQALKMLRYSRAIHRFHRAFIIAREEFVLFFSTTLMLLYFSSVGIYYFENPVQPDVFKSVFHSMWWSVATLTTVGYGDMSPVTVGGRLFTFIVLMLGLGVVAVPAGLFSSALSTVRREELEERDKAASKYNPAP